MRRANTGTGGPRSGSSASQDPEPVDPLYFIEARSRINEHVPTANWTWQIGHILRALNQGKVEEARARAYLGLAAGEQVSMNRGSWVHAWEMTLTEEPPYDVLAWHSGGRRKQPHSQLVNAEFFETVQARLKTIDDATERMRRLEGRQPPKYQGDEDRPPKKPGRVPPKGPKGDAPLTK